MPARVRLGPQNQERPACPWATSLSVRVQTRSKAGSAKLFDCKRALRRGSRAL